MAVSKLDQVAAAPAVIRPTGKAKIVNHPDGGRVVQIYVTEGQDVQRGDVLVRFDGDLIDQEINKLVAQYSAMAGDVARLIAETEATELVFPDDLADQPRLRADEESLYRSRQDQLRNQRLASDSQVEQIAAKTEGLREQIAGLTDSEKYLRQQEQALKKVTDMKYFPEIRYLSVMRDLSELQGKLGQARRDLVASERAYEEAKQRRELIDSQWMADAKRQLGAATADRDRFKAALEQQRQLKRNLELRAPENGTVKDLRALSAGQYFRAGEPILGIIPADEIGLEVEARVSNIDRGFVQLNQVAILKFTAFDWIRYGVLQGHVVQIDRDATNPATDDSGATKAGSQPYFKVVIRFDYDPDTGRPLTTLVRANEAYPITAGMTAIAELHIGERSILEFFTDRIFSTVQGSFREK